MTNKEHDLHHRLERCLRAKGYTYDKERGKYQVYFRDKNKTLLNQRVNTEKEAILLRKKYIKEYLNG